VIPVSAFIPGCPASPKAIIDGLVKLLSSLEDKEEQKNKPEAENAC
jgi:Ni,Fe-hydrogenase III small subunit